MTQIDPRTDPDSYALAAISHDGDTEIPGLGVFPYEAYDKLVSLYDRDKARRIWLDACARYDALHAEED